MARSKFYYHLKRLDSVDGYEEYRKRISEIYHMNHGRYGYRRITLQMKAEGCNINHKTVRKLMLQLGIKCQIRKVKYRSYKGSVGDILENIIARDFSVDRPYKKLATDVTQINVKDEKSFLSPVLDMFNGEILGYNISNRPDLNLVLDMLKNVFKVTRGLDGKAILHSDQGWQYQHRSYQRALAKHDITPSMSRKGNCLDNAMMENFFGLMKSELLYAETFESMDHFKQKLKEYIEWYNNKRIKLRLKGMSPVQYRTQFQKNNNV